jgi:PAS domain S-box-containing protein
MLMAWEDLQHLAWLSTPVWVYDHVVRRIAWANEAALGLWQAQSIEALCQRDLSDQSPAVTTRLEALFEETAGGRTVRVDWVLHPVGQPTPVNLTVRAIAMTDGHPALCIEATPTQSARIESSTLRGVEAVLHFSLAVVMFDLAGNVLMKNPAAQRVFPQLADGDGNAFLRLLDKPDEAARIWQGAIENGADQGERLFSARPKSRWYAYSLHRVLDPVTGDPAMLFSGQDVTERVLSEKKFRVLFEQSANPMMLFDPESGRVSDCNRAAAQALRLGSRKQLIDMDPAAFYPPLQPDGHPSLARAREISEHTLKRGWHRFEWLFRRGDGGELLVEVTLSPVQLGDDTMLLAVWYDLSFRRLIERQLLEAKDAAEAANSAKSQFLANMSHEIRTPLNAIVGMTGLLQQTELNATQRQWLDMVRFSSEGLVELVGDILDFSRIEAGKLDLECRVFDLRALVAKTAELLRFRADEKRLLLGLTMDAALPRWVEGDEARLRQVLVNLIGNAVKFTSKGSVTLSLRVIGKPTDSVTVRAEVKDTGIGIEAAKLGTIFEAFTQADDSISRRYGGSGLGLTISRRLIHAMGGDLKVESTPGVGSVFHFDLPLKLANVPAEDTIRRLEGAPAKVLHILLAEDNVINQKLALALLEQAGHTVAVANNGEEAVDLYMRDTFDLVLMDMQMPEMDGLQATRAIRALEQGRRTPIVAMTANVLPEDRERCFAAGMDDFLSKPISLARLGEVLHGVVAESLSVTTGSIKQPAAPVVFDLDAALSACGGNASLLEELAILFEQEWPGRRAALMKAAKEGNYSVLARNAHTLKGSFGALASEAGANAALAVDAQAKLGEVPAPTLELLCKVGDALSQSLADWRAMMAH